MLLGVYKSNPFDGGKLGILNFASPGGDFKDCSEASIAQSSTLYLALKTDEVQQFHKLHTRESTEITAAYYYHGINILETLTSSAKL